MSKRPHNHPKKTAPNNALSLWWDTFRQSDPISCKFELASLSISELQAVARSGGLSSSGTHRALVRCIYAELLKPSAQETDHG